VLKQSWARTKRPLGVSARAELRAEPRGHRVPASEVLADLSGAAGRVERCRSAWSFTVAGYLAADRLIENPEGRYG